MWEQVRLWLLVGSIVTILMLLDALRLRFHEQSLRRECLRVARVPPEVARGADPLPPPPTDDMALEELRELIGEQAFQSYREQGYFTFEADGRTFALADPTRAYRTQAAVQTHMADRWQFLCVSPTPDAPIAIHDSTIILYRWIVHRTTNFLETARLDTLGTLEQIVGPPGMVAQQPFIPQRDEVAGDARPLALPRMSLTHIGNPDLEARSIQILRQAMIQHWSRRIGTYPEPVLRDLLLCDIHDPNVDSFRFRFRPQSSPSAYMLFRSVNADNTVLGIWGFQIDPRDAAHCVQLRVTALPYTICLIPLDRLYAPYRQVREEGRETWEFHTYVVLDSNIIVLPGSTFTLEGWIEASSERSESASVWVRPLGYAMEPNGQNISI